MRHLINTTLLAIAGLFATAAVAAGPHGADGANAASVGAVPLKYLEKCYDEAVEQNDVVEADDFDYVREGNCDITWSEIPADRRAK